MSYDRCGGKIGVPSKTESSTVLSQPDFRALFESAPDSYLVLTSSLEIVAVTDAYLRDTMTRREEILGRYLFDVFPDNPDDPAATGVSNLRASLERVLLHRVPDTMVAQKYDVRRPESEGGGFEERYWSPINSPVLGANGEVNYIIHRVEDITERRKAEEAQHRLAAIVESSADAVISTTLDGTVTTWNKGAERLYGYTAAEITGKPITLLLPPDRMEEDAAIIARLRQGERIEHFETVRRAQNGRLVDVSLMISPIWDERGEIVGISKIARDITERKRAEEALRRSERKYRALFDSIDVGMCTIEMLFDESEKPVDYRFLEVNPSFEKLTGIQNALDRRMREIAPLHEEHWFEIYGRVALTGDSVHFENQAAQLHRWYEVYAVRVGEPRQRHVAIHFKDITDRKEAEEALRRAHDELETRVKQRTVELQQKNRDLETLLYVTSHDLREPLRAIENFSRLVHDRYAERLDEKGKDYLQRVVRGAQRMDRLMTDLLALSRVQRMEFPREDTEASSLVQEALRQLERRIKETCAQVRVAADLPLLHVNRIWAIQGISNLIANALKFTGEGEAPDIEIAPYEPVDESGARIGLVVRDRGPGVAPAHADRIFQLFQRAVGREVEGTGAGLAIVRQIAERHGGRAWVQPREGGGSEFILTFGAAPVSQNVSPVARDNGHARSSH